MVCQATEPLCQAYYIKGHPDFETLIVYLVFTQIAIMVLIIIPTEIKLNNVFTKEGYRKHKMNPISQN